MNRIRGLTIVVTHIHHPLNIGGQAVDDLVARLGVAPIDGEPSLGALRRDPEDLERADEAAQVGRTTLLWVKAESLHHSRELGRAGAGCTTEAIVVAYANFDFDPDTAGTIDVQDIGASYPALSSDDPVSAAVDACTCDEDLGFYCHEKACCDKCCEINGDAELTIAEVLGG